MQCPKCNVEMDEVSKLGVIIDSCSKCGGVWLDKGELDKIRAAEAAAREEAPPPAATQEHGHHHEEHHGHNEEHGGKHGHKKKKRGSFMDIFEGFGGE